METQAIEVIFKGNDTLEEIYRLKLKSLKESLTCLATVSDTKKLQSIKLELFELQAIVENAYSRAKYPSLYKDQKDIKPEDKREWSPCQWTIVNGQRVNNDE